ncbi:DNA modification methylase (plasmid) [Clostridium botulinum]|uniref:DNA modification methylase n=2 Tax=Clostridium botulinum TaxID=1491 RepID=A0A846I052_CLOBO|nr:restriction endonuclease subunit M [Clostridium botulinum]ACQ51254.1 putative DNA modification methylase [Clostridium botulinum Ba4 str. 657]AXG90239.1 DNA modification methylase [Clostridium botulinum]NEZ92908.1 DNA modification methylase [Clostridium botulinum]
MLEGKVLEKLYPYLTKDIINIDIKDYGRKKEVILENKMGDKFIGDLTQERISFKKVGGLTSIAEYFARGKYGSNSWRGNCSGLLIKDILLHYNIKEFCDPMLGSGTSLDVAKDLNIKCLGMDLNPKFGGFNIIKDEFPKSFEFMFLHPPYYVFKGSKMPVYSGNQWGNVAHIDDGSHMHDKNQFTKWFNTVLYKSYLALKKGGRIALLVGDSRFKSDYYSMFKEMNVYGKIENVIIKKQYNCVSDNIKYANKFIPIQHEYLVIIKKDQELIIPCTIVKKRIFSMLDVEQITWRSLIQNIIEYLGGKTTREEIYNMVIKSKKAKNNNNIKAKIRQIINSYPNEFIKSNDDTVSLAA